MPDDTTTLVIDAVLFAGWVVQEAVNCFLDCPTLLVIGDKFDSASTAGFE